MSDQSTAAPGLRLVVTASILDRIGFSALQPLIPFLVLHFGGSPVLVTQLVAVFFLASFVGSPALGLLSDKVGRITVVMLSLFVSLLCYVGILVSWSLAGVFIFRAITGVLDGRSTVLRALGTDGQSQSDQVKRVSWLMGSGGIGKMIGPAIASVIALMITDPDSQYRAILIFVSVLTGVTMLLFARPRNRNRNRNRTHIPPAKTKTPSQPRGTIGLLATVKPLVRPLGLTVIIAFGEAIMLSITALFVHHRFGWTVKETGLLLTAMAAGLVFARLVLLPLLAARLGTIASLRLTLMLSALNLLGMALSFDALVYVIFGLMFSVTLGVASTLPTAMVSVQAPAHARGYALGINDAVRALALAFAASTNGWWFELVSPNAPHLFACLVLLIGIAAASTKSSTDHALH